MDILPFPSTFEQDIEEYDYYKAPLPTSYKVS